MYGVYARLAAAAVRGHALRAGLTVPDGLGSKPLEALTEEELAAMRHCPG